MKTHFSSDQNLSKKKNHIYNSIILKELCRVNEFFFVRPKITRSLTPPIDRLCHRTKESYVCVGEKYDNYIPDLMLIFFYTYMYHYKCK
jgi:hypothetical protein